MENVGDTILTVLVIGGILIIPALLTNAFTRAMYYRCEHCRSLNAKRRSLCRVCGHELDIKR
jgi:rRNA maturation endonuclease Nob1